MTQTEQRPGPEVATPTAVAAGGALGALGRWGSTVALAGSGWPWSTLAVNVSGALAIGLLVAWLEVRTAPTWVRPFAVTGLLGGWTTYSTFVLDATGLGWAGLGYVAATLVLGVGACALGLVAGERLVGPGGEGGGATLRGSSLRSSHLRDRGPQTPHDRDRGRR